MGRRLGIVLVVLLIGLLFALVVGRLYFSGDGDRSYSLARAQLEVLAAKIDTYVLDTGRAPAELSELTVPIENSSGSGPYARERELIDPWGVPYYYRVREGAGSFLLFTLGSDGRLGGSGNANDLQVERPEPAS